MSFTFPPDDDAPREAANRPGHGPNADRILEGRVFVVNGAACRRQVGLGSGRREMSWDVVTAQDVLAG